MMVTAFEKAWQENYDKKSSRGTNKEGSDSISHRDPTRRTGSRIPNDTIDENSTESIIEVVNEVVDGN